MTEPTIAEQLAELRRERAMRARVYPRWIDAGRMTDADADRQMGRLDATIRVLETIADGTIRIPAGHVPDLFAIDADKPGEVERVPDVEPVPPSDLRPAFEYAAHWLEELYRREGFSRPGLSPTLTRPGRDPSPTEKDAALGALTATARILGALAGALRPAAGADPLDRRMGPRGSAARVEVWLCRLVDLTTEADRAAERRAAP